MPRFCANLTFLFKEVPFLDRFAEAKDAGFDAVEILFPYDDPVTEITDRLKSLDLSLALINTPPPNWTGGDRGFAAVPGGEERFRRDFTRALRYAGRLKPAHLHIMAGKAQGLVARTTYLRNIEWAAEQAHGQSLTIEPINPVDMPGYFLSDFEVARRIIEDIGAPNLGLQYDAYHAQMITGDAMAVWDAHRDITRHVQVGGYPGRHEPLKGEIDYPAFFARLDAEGYGGFVSGEYNPKGRTEDGLGWIA